MGCASSHDALAAAAAAVASRARAAASSSRPRGADPATLCRERAALVRAAADRRFALAAAHAAYFRSLAAVGDALRRFAAAALLPATPQAGSSPVLTLPPSPAKPASAAAAATSSLPPSSSSSSTVSPLSHSLSDNDLEALSGRGSGMAAAYSSRHHHHHYMRSSSTVPTVVHENPYAQYTEGETSYRYDYGYGHAYPYGPDGEVVAEERPETAPRPPPSPPAAEASPWEFFNPFTTYDQFLEDYSRSQGEVDAGLPTNSPNYSEMRRMEGIPELEDEAELEAAAAAAAASKPTTSGVADQSAKGKRPVPPTNAGSKSSSSDGKLRREGSGSGAYGQPVKLAPRNDSAASKTSSKSKNVDKSSVASFMGADGGDIDSGSSTGKNKGVAFDEDRDRSTIAADRDGGSHGKPVQPASISESFSPLHHGERDVVEAMDDVKKQFNDALNCGAEVSRLLEVGKLPHGDTAAPRVLRYFSSRLVDPLQNRRSRSSSSKAGTSAPSVADRRNGTGSLSSTLEKLCVWEKKLFQEVKEEEKMRIMYEKKYRKLKSLDERGAEAETIDSTRLSVRNLQSRIAVSIRTVNAFSSKIQKIRDEELYPQLVDLIQGLKRMWKAVLECHEKQLVAIEDSKIHLLKAVTISQSSASAKATVELERELEKWHRCFNKWISTQRSYAEALNGWLKRWLPEVQEEDTPDGVPPFSPGKLGAPPVFVISNDWFQAIEMVPKNEVLGSMDRFSKLVHDFKKIQENEHRQRQKAERSSRIYRGRHEVLKNELGLRSSLDMVALVENPHGSHDDRIMELKKMWRRMHEEVTRHEELIQSVHHTASATLPSGLVPMLKEMIEFFQENVQAYMHVRIQGA